MSHTVAIADERFLRRILTVLIAATMACGTMALSLAVNANTGRPVLVASAAASGAQPLSFHFER